MLYVRNCLLIFETLSTLINNFMFTHFKLTNHIVTSQLIKELVFSKIFFEKKNDKK